MGSYAECWIGNLHVGTSKNGVDRQLVGLFREGDRITCESTNPALPVQISNRWADENDKPKEAVSVTYYCAPVSVIKDRLELQGYTLDTSKRLFETWIEIERAQWESWEWTNTSDSAQSKIQRLRELTAELWLVNIGTINAEGLTPRDQERYKDSHLGDMLEGLRGEGWYGYDGPDPLVALRLAIEVCPSDADMTYDVTELVLSEYFSIDEEIIERGLQDSAQEFASFGRVVILTEGRTDAWILKESLGLLYPHLLEYFSFMDFEGFRVGGGAGQLANLVKAFSAAGIVNRVIAVFDNDTASDAAMRGLKRTRVPKHIVALRLPDLESLRSYPTLGPAGLTLMNVNGMAASIELYCGDDVLKNDSGGLMPIQWTGWESTVRQYQGELENKAEVHERFRQKINSCRNDSSLLDTTDWTGLRLILAAILSAFHALDLEAHTRFMYEFYGRDIS